MTTWCVFIAVIKASNANALDTILELLEADDPTVYSSTDSVRRSPPLQEMELTPEAAEPAQAQTQEQGVGSGKSAAEAGEDDEDEEDEEDDEEEEAVVWADVTIVRCGVGGVTLSDVSIAAENRCDVWCFAPDDAAGLSRGERGGVEEQVARTAKSYNVGIRNYRLLPELAEALEDWRRVYL